MSIVDERSDIDVGSGGFGTATADDPAGTDRSANDRAVSDRPANNRAVSDDLLATLAEVEA